MTVIVLSGPIGAGKSSLTGILSKYLGTKPFYESVDDNPVLPLFYADPASLLHYLGNYNSSTPLILILITALGANGVIEAIFTALVVPVIVTPLNLVLKRA